MTPADIQSIIQFSRDTSADAQHTRRIFGKAKNIHHSIYVRAFKSANDPDLEVFDKNPSATAPYHNNLHQATVALTAQFIVETKGEKHLSLAAVENLGWPIFVDAPLFIAGLFHDYGHSGGALEDHINIARATAIVQNFNIQSGWMNEILSLIAVTEYPFIREPKTGARKALRDADLVCALLLTPTMYFQQYVMGLRAEMEVKLGKSISIREFAEGQMKFLDSTKFYAIEGTVLEKQYRDFNHEFYTALLSADGID